MTKSVDLMDINYPKSRKGNKQATNEKKNRKTKNQKRFRTPGAPYGLKRWDWSPGGAPVMPTNSGHDDLGRSAGLVTDEVDGSSSSSCWLYHNFAEDKQGGLLI